MKKITFLFFLVLAVAKIAEADKLPFRPDTIIGKKVDTLFNNQAFRFYRFDDSISLSFFIDDSNPKEPLFVSLLIYSGKVARAEIINDYTWFEEESVSQIVYADDEIAYQLEQYWKRKYQRLPDYKSIPQNFKEVSETFGAGCGAAGIPMGKGGLYQQLLSDKDLTIEKLMPYLYSLDPTERLTAFLLMNKFKSVPDELDIVLSGIRNNSYRFSYCSGCTVGGSWTAKKIYQDFFGSSR